MPNRAAILIAALLVAVASLASGQAAPSSRLPRHTERLVRSVTALILAVERPHEYQIVRPLTAPR
jgi:hypothetical protein